jgi:YD repeat-containing protein
MIRGNLRFILLLAGLAAGIAVALPRPSSVSFPAPISQTDALGHVTRWEYDALGRTTKRTLPKGQFETFEYDLVGNVAKHTTFNGEVVSYTYDALNRLSTKTLPADQRSGLVEELDDCLKKINRAKAEGDLFHLCIVM